MGLFSREKKTETEKPAPPRHVAVIMDGNGRWAKKRGLPRKYGHKAGAEVFRTIAFYCRDIGVKFFTVYAFSTENWKRPKDEVEALMNLFRNYLKEAAETMNSKGVAVKVIGNMGPLPDDLKKQIEDTNALADRQGNEVPVATLCVNYGGRDEIKNAVRRLAFDVKEGRLDPEDVTEDAISERLYTVGMPDPDLIIRPSGEQRTSNFLLWQSAYSEYYFTDVLWPDFRPKDMDKAIEAYHKRQRRFGGV